MLNRRTGFALPLSRATRIEAAKGITAALLLFFLLVIIYWPSFHGKWVLDDFDNIRDNTSLHVHALTWSALEPALSGPLNKGIHLHRPVAYFSLALNYYFGRNDPFGYHVVNFAIHFTAALTLFLLFYGILKLPVCRGRYESIAYPTALMAAALWAVNPVHVTAVTYIVQRMASLAGMFTAIALLCYMHGRNASRRPKRILFFTLTAVSGLLALGSKENAAMLPASLFFFELFLFTRSPRASRKMIGFGLAAFALIGLISLGFVHWDTILNGYRDRPFSLGERLLTESRIFFLYLGWLLFPTGSRLALLHDIRISTSLVHPWTTLPAVVLVLLTPVACLVFRKRWPLAAFAVLFFWLNHLIEGSVIPIELIFEHRNYLPSIFLFLPIAIGIMRFLDYFSYRPLLQWLGAIAFATVLAANGHTTYLRNELFTDPALLWLDNVNAYPNLLRPHHNLGNCYMAMGLEKEALAAYTAALHASSPSMRAPQLITHYNFGIYYQERGTPETARPYFLTILKYSRNYTPALLHLAELDLLSGDLHAARSRLAQIFSIKKDSPEARIVYGYLMLRRGKLEEAIRLGYRVLNAAHPSAMALQLLGDAYYRIGNYPKAGYFYGRLQSLSPQDPVNFLALAATETKTGKLETARKRLREVLAIYGDLSFDAILKRYGERRFQYRFPQIEDLKDDHRRLLCEDSG